MAYITTAERMGIQKGAQQGVAAILIQLLQRRFPQVPANYLEKVLQANAETLLIWAGRLLAAQLLEMCFNKDRWSIYGNKQLPFDVIFT